MVQVLADDELGGGEGSRTNDELVNVTKVNQKNDSFFV